MADPDLVLDPDLVARSGRHAGAAKLRCSGRRQHRGSFFLSCLTRTLDGFGPPVTALATSSGVHRGPQPGKRRARLAPWQPPALLASLTSGDRSCATPADARVAGLVHALGHQGAAALCLHGQGRPPVPLEGGFERPAEHNAGGLCALAKRHGRCARRRSSSVRLRPHNPRYVQRAAAATALRSAAVRCGSRHVVHAPARPAVLPRRLQPLTRLPLPPGQARRPSAPEGLPKSERTKPKAKAIRAFVEGKLCLLALVRLAACSVRQG